MGTPRARKAAIPPLLKNLNERAVLETIRDGAPISRAEISRRAGISKPTVSLALRALLEAGLVRESPDEPDGPTYGAVYFEPVPEAALVVGLDLGARFLRSAVCDLLGTIRARQDVELRPPAVDAALEIAPSLLASLLASTGIDAEAVDAVIVGVPGVVDAKSGTVKVTHLADLDGRAFARELSGRLDLPVTLENDINLAALGEQWLGVARGVADFVFLSVGTGLGAGLVLRGELHRGHHGAAGEVDYALVGLAHEVDPSAAAVSSLASTLVKSGTTALEPPFEVRSIFAAARGGDSVARAVVDEVARRIALHIGAVAAVADVELAVLGGGLGANGDLLLAPVRSLLGGWLPYPPRVEVSSLGEGAVLTGALAVGRRAALDNVFANRRRESLPQ
jgi:predicted NBD/HSP70 family sugar kinase/DNA-binding CsgD family transcriptional regulator